MIRDALIHTARRRWHTVHIAVCFVVISFLGSPLCAQAPLAAGDGAPELTTKATQAIDK